MMKVLFSIGDTTKFFQLEKHESELQTKFILRWVRIDERSEIVGAMFNKYDLEKLRDAIDLEIGPKS